MCVPFRSVLVLPHATYVSAGCICFSMCMSCRRELVFHQSHVCVSKVHVLLYVQPVLQNCPFLLLMQLRLRSSTPAYASAGCICFSMCVPFRSVLVLPHTTYTSAGCICFGTCMSCMRELVFHQIKYASVGCPCASICACPSHLCLRASTPAYASAGCI
jgi:hypothetical protein